MSLVKEGQAFPFREPEHKATIIALHGLPQAGKTTIAEHLMATHGFNRIGFGDHLKFCASCMFDLKHAQIFGDLKDTVDERWGQTPRRILQKLGTEVAREIHSEVWVRPLIDQIMANHPSKKWVVDDLRFPNERKALEEMGASFVKVIRPRILEMTRFYLAHESNQELPAPWRSLSGTERSWDHVIFNEGEVHHLWQKVDDLIVSLHK